MNSTSLLAVATLLSTAATAAPSLSIGHDPLRGNLSLAFPLSNSSTQVAIGLNGVSYTGQTTQEAQGVNGASKTKEGLRVSFALGATHFFKADQGLMVLGGIAPSVGYDPELLVGAGLGWRWKFGAVNLDAGAWGGALVTSSGVHLPPALTLEGDSEGIRSSGMAPLFVSVGYTF